MLVLGKTSKDKGGQLEGLIHAELTGQGYKNVYSNVVSSGGNELDVVAVHETEALGISRRTPLVCEAKAYADAVDMPTWQKFLGKLLLERTERPATAGLLVALNGINGNVRGSYQTLRSKDDGVVVLDGGQLLRRAQDAGELAGEEAVRSAVAQQFRRQASSLEVAYYGGGYFWIAWWSDSEYSVMDGRGNSLSAEEVENVRSALAGSIRGSLVPVEISQAYAEDRHAARTGLLDLLFKSGGLQPEDTAAVEHDLKAAAELILEPFCEETDGEIHLVPAPQLDSESVARLFLFLFDNALPVRNLEFMASRGHVPYLARLIDTLADRQAGFELCADDQGRLSKLAPYFPSVWAALAQPIDMIVNHRRNDHEGANEMMDAADRNTFWELIARAARDDFTNVFLRGFLYDHMGLAELEESSTLTFKSKTGVITSVETELRSAVGQLSDEYTGEAGTRHVLIRLLPTAPEPWDGGHPEPLPLDEKEDAR